MPPSPLTCGDVHDLGAAGDTGQRHTVGDALGGHDEIRLDTFVFAREHRPGAREPGLDLVGDEHDIVLAAPIQQRRQEAVGGHDEAALTLDGFDDHRSEVVGADLLVHHRDRTPGRKLAVGGHLLAEFGVAERV